jgi:hypothetical protein
MSRARGASPPGLNRALRPDSTRTLPGKMRLTDVCNRPTTRAPCESHDSRLRLHEPCGPLRAPTRGRSHGLHLGGASLDGDPPASALDAHRVATQIPGAFDSGHGANEIPLGPGGCRDRRPLRRYPSAAVFSPARRAGDVASDAPCRIRRSPARLAPHRHSRLGFRLTGLRRTPDPLPPPSRQRRLLPQARAPSVDECSLRPLAQTSQGTRHRLTTLPSRSGFRRPFAPSPLSGERLDPPPSGDRPGAARRLLQSPRSTSTTDRIA